MTKLAPVIITLVIAGAAGFAAGRATSGLDARVAASGAAIAAEEGCAAFASGTWPIGAAGYTIEGRAFGADCADATAVLVIRNNGSPVYQSALATPWVLGLAGAMTPDAMTEALSAWVAPSGPNTTGALPAWAQGTEGPEAAEFPFVPHENWTQENYEQLRTQNLPMFCFAAGLESARCLVARETVLEEIGLQSLAG